LTMVLDSVISLKSLFAFVGGVGSKLAYDELSRKRQNQFRQKNNRIQWHEDLISLSSEIKHFTMSSATFLRIMDEEEYLTEAFYERLSSEGQGQYRLLLSLEHEEPEIAIDDELEDLQEEARSRVITKSCDEIETYFDKLNVHISEGPDNVNEELRDSASKLLAHLFGISTTRSLSENRLKKIQDLADDVISDSETAIEEIEGSNIFESLIFSTDRT